MSDISAISSVTDTTTLNARIAPNPAAMALKLGDAATNAKIDKAAEDFESMFATEMLRPMFDGLEVDPMFGGGHGEEAMRSFLLQEYGKSIAHTGKLGITKQVRAEMLRMQEKASGKRGGSSTSAGTAANAYRNAALGRNSLSSGGNADVSVQ